MPKFAVKPFGDWTSMESFGVLMTENGPVRCYGFRQEYVLWPFSGRASVGVAVRGDGMVTVYPPYEKSVYRKVRPWWKPSATYVPVKTGDRIVEGGVLAAS